jgi:hypothetical protein
MPHPLRPRVLEIITARVHQTDAASAVAELDRDLEEARSMDRLLHFHLYRRASIGTDLVVLLWRRAAPCGDGSTLGLRIASGLRQMGRVKHTVWMRVGRGGAPGETTAKGERDVAL